MSKKTAGLIMTGVFVMPHADTYDEYIDYMGRSEAVRNENFNKFNAFEDVDGVNVIDGAGESQFERYTDYMSNPEKTKSLFNQRYDRMPIEDVQYTKKYFMEGQDNGSPLWQLVFSFRNEWLEEQGLMDRSKHEVNEAKIYDATRLAMKQLMDKAELNAEWLGSIHFNTKHIHVHVGMVERNPSREWIYYKDEKNPENTGWQFKGKLKINHINSAKSKFVNELLNMQNELIKVDEQMKNLTTTAKANVPKLKEQLFRQSIHELQLKLPANKRRWTYGYAKGQKFKAEIDRVVTLYLNTYAKEELESFIQRVQPISATYEEAYGNPKNEPTYLENKLYGKNGLYHTLGNIVLNELKELSRQQNKQQSQERFTLEDLKQLEKEEQCVRSDLPSPEDLFEADDVDEYEYYMTNLLQGEPPEVQDEFISDELYQALNQYESLVLEEPLMKGVLDKLKADLLARTPTNEEIREKLFALDEEEKRSIEKRGVVVREEGHAEPVQLVKNETIKGYLAIPGSSADVVIVGQEKSNSESARKEQKEEHNINSFSRKNREGILEQNPNATFIYGENQWRLAGKNIIESERSRPIIIYAPVFEGEGEQKRLTGFNPVPMYDVSQTKNAEKKTFVYSNQEGVQIEKNPYVRGGQGGGGYSDPHAFDRQLKQMMNKLENATQRYLNEKAFKEMEYQQTLS
ncbi:MobP2 family relaxase [Enterococcus wangshanyuanii]|uniref:Uncharacterized protein n=1 Tax=Enterococcus wangshanyuanii TaxID=2005703 RepID=A0ABQ1PRD8_9ENTE|nr:MobP2 family relaxase [Enterococcus wangshanyuanii]GGD01884.1 hypothetical protein GCM10011573_34270 [Enterococcus wangshanyuanii]